MKTIYKGNNFVIQWSIMDAVTSLPFDFNDMFVEFVVYSENYNGRISGCKITGNKMQAEIMANTLPIGVYDLVCSYRNSINSGHCICRRAFNITRNPGFCSNTNKIVIESHAAPLRLENMDINYLGHFPSEGMLPDSDRPAWSLVGTLKFARPWFYYTPGTVPPGYQSGWNDLSEVLGTYDLTADKVSIFDFNLVTEYNVSRNHPNIKRDFSKDWGVSKLFYPEYEEYRPCKVYDEGEHANMPDYTDNTFIALRETSEAPFTTISVSSEFTLGEAIDITPDEYRFPGIRLTFVNSDTHQAETWFWLGGEWEEEDKWIKPISDVTINNLPDEEDISSTNDAIPRLQLKDKEYNKSSFSGLGRVYLRKNIVNGMNILSQDMLVKDNTRYVIQYDYNLNGQTLEVPENCVLDFQGGCLTNGTMICSDTEIKGNVRLDVSLDGIVANSTLYMDWFVGNDYIRNLRSLHKVLKGNGEICFTNNGFYEINLSDGILVDLKSNVKINGRGCTIKIADGTNTSSYIWKTIFKAREGVENISIKNIVLDVNNQNNMFSYAPTWQKEERCSLLDTNKAKNIVVQNCTINNNYGLNDFILAGTDNVTIDNCRFVNCGTIVSSPYIVDHSNIFGTGSNWRITNNYIYNENRLNKGTGLDLNCKDSVISANYVEHCYAGLNLSNNGTFECENNVVSDNIFVDNHCAVYFWSRRADGVEHGASNIIVKNNLIYWKARGLQYECRGIDLFRFVVSEVKNINIIGNTIYSIVDENTNLATSNEHAILLGANYYDIINSGTVNTRGKVYNINISNNVIHTITGYGISLQDKTSNVSIVQNTLKDCHIGTLTSASAAIELMTKYDKENPIEHVNINDNVYYNDKYNTNYGLRLEKLVRNIKILFNDFRSAKPTGMEIVQDVDTNITYPNIRPENIFVRGFLNKSEVGAFTAVKCIDGSELYDTFRGIVYKPSASYSNGYWRSENYYKSAALPNIALPRAGSMVWSAAPEETGCIGHVVMKNAEEGNPVIRAFGRDCMCTTMGGSNRPEKHAYGYPFFDTTLNKPIWQKADGTWVDANGDTV